MAYPNYNNLQHASFEVLKLLSNGQFQQKSDISDILTKREVRLDELIEELYKVYNIELNCDAYHGFYISQRFIPLNQNDILVNLTRSVSPLCQEVLVYPSLDSTNKFIHDLNIESPSQAIAVVCEHQSHGKGRGDRRWLSPFGSNIYFSLKWQFNHAPKNMASFSLVVAVVVAKMLLKYGLNHVKIKWPNDVWVNYKKIAGILLEQKSRPNNRSDSSVSNNSGLIIGIGINHNMSASQGADIQQAWTCMLAESIHQPLDRNQIIASLIDALVLACQKFEQYGFEFFKDTYTSFDATLGKPVKISTKYDGQDVDHGVSSGVNEQGALIIKQANGSVKTYLGGELSLSLDK